MPGQKRIFNTSKSLTRWGSLRSFESGASGFSINNYDTSGSSGSGSGSGGRPGRTRRSTLSVLDTNIDGDTTSCRGPLEGEQLVIMETEDEISKFKYCKDFCVCTLILSIFSAIVVGTTALLYMFSTKKMLISRHSFRLGAGTTTTENNDQAATIITENDGETPDTITLTMPTTTTTPVSTTSSYILPSPPYDLQEKCSPNQFLQTAEGLAICEMICGPATSCCIVTNKQSSLCYETNQNTCMVYYEFCQHIYVNGEIFGSP